MLIDDWMPTYHFNEYHEKTIAAPVERVYETLMSVDLLGHPVPLLLLGLRSLPAVLMGKERHSGPRPRLTLRDAPRFQFQLLEERPPAELVLGVTGRFWRPADGIEETVLADFREFVPDGRARAAWDFTLVPTDGDRTLLATETRILCADEAVRRTFGRYWRFVQPGSGLIRRVMLGMVRREAESAA